MKTRKGIHMQSELLTIPEVCKLSNLGTTNIYALINRGEISAKKVGRKTLIPRQAFNEWMENLQPYPVQRGK